MALVSENPTLRRVIGLVALTEWLNRVTTSVEQPGKLEIWWPRLVFLFPLVFQGLATMVKHYLPLITLQLINLSLTKLS